MVDVKHIALLVLVACFAFGCSKNTTDDPKTDPEAKSEKPEKEEPKEVAEPTPAGDIYPGFQFGLVKPENRVKFVKFAKAELCPCEENGAVSLHECLQKTEGRCRVAMSVAEMGAMMYEAGYTETDVTDKISEYIDSTKKTHTFELKDRPFKGNADAPVTVVEFADFQCPHCKEASKIFSKLSKKHPAKFKVYYKHFPLSAHQFAPFASRAAVAAGNQGKFWEMHDLLFKYQEALGPEKLIELGQRIGLNMQKYKADLESEEVAKIVATDRQEGADAKLTGTPTLYINGKLYLGEIEEEAILNAIEEAGTTETN